MMTAPTIRPFTPEDLEACIRLYMKTFSREPWNDSWESSDVVRTFLKRHMANNYFTAYVAEQDGRLLGASIGFMKPYIRGMEYYIDEYFIDPDSQGQGIGRLLMDGIRDDLKAQGVHAIMLLTERDYPAYAFYKRIGFEAEETMHPLFSSF